MSLEVRDLKERNKKYITDEGVFLLRPPYMYIVDEFQKKINKINSVQEIFKNSEGEVNLNDFLEKVQKNDNKEISKKIINIEIDILKLLLEETGEGSLNNINEKNFRVDFFNLVINDFFQQFGKLTNIVQ